MSNARLLKLLALFLTLLLWGDRGELVDLKTQEPELFELMLRKWKQLERHYHEMSGAGNAGR